MSGADDIFHLISFIFEGADDWLTPEDYDIVWKINTLGLIRMTQKFKKLLKVAR